MSGETPVLEYGYVSSSAVPGLPYFSSPLRLGRRGVEEVLPLGRMDAMETENFEAMKAELLGSIQKGEEFVARGPAK